MEAANIKAIVGVEGNDAMMDSGNSLRVEHKGKPRMGKYVVACTVIATVSSVLLGYDMGIISGALLFITDELKLNIVQQEVLVGSLSLVSLVGGGTAGRLSDAIGRRKTMAVASAIFFAAAVIMGFAPSFAVLMVGRVLSGIAVGFALMIAPVYSAELSPAAVRGSLVSLTEIFINFGILLGYIVSFAFQGLPTNINWRLMLGFGAIPSILLACGVLVLPESPRWLVTQGRLAEAKQILIKASGGDNEEASIRLKDIMETAGFTNIDPNVDPTVEHFEADAAKIRKQGEGVWRELLRPSRPVRRMLIVALGIHFFAQASGIDATVYYSPVVFHEAGIKSKMGLLGATVVVGFTKFMFIFVAFFFLDRAGRKPLLLISSAGMAVSLIVVAIAFITLGLNSAQGDSLVSVNVAKHAHEVPKAGAVITIVAICVYVAFFSIGFGPVGWVLPSEIFPLRIRAQAMGAAVVLNRIVGGTIALTFLSMSKAMTPAGVMFFFAGLISLSFVFVYFVFPETKGKTLEELTIIFEGNVKKENVSQGPRVEDYEALQPTKDLSN